MMLENYRVRAMITDQTIMANRPDIQ